MVLEPSPVADQGFNSSALQLSDALGTVLFIGVGGALFAGLHTEHGSNAGAFLTIYLVMATVAAVGVALAGGSPGRTGSGSTRVSTCRRVLATPGGVGMSSAGRR